MCSSSVRCFFSLAFFSFSFVHCLFCVFAFALAHYFYSSSSSLLSISVFFSLSFSENFHHIFFFHVSILPERIDRSGFSSKIRQCHSIYAHYFISGFIHLPLSLLWSAIWTLRTIHNVKVFFFCGWRNDEMKLTNRKDERMPIKCE